MVPYIEDGVELQKAAAEAGKKNVFLIGDSLRMGYCETVKTDLSDVANVFYPAENCRNSQYIITCLRTWSTLCDPKTVDPLGRRPLERGTGFPDPPARLRREPPGAGLAAAAHLPQCRRNLRHLHPHEPQRRPGGQPPLQRRTAGL